MKQILTILILTVIISVVYITYIANVSYPMKVVDVQKSYIHFSLDDVTKVTNNLSSPKYNSVFEDSTLAQLKDWHDKYGIVASLYVMGSFTINSKYASELINNKDWLKFGYHGIEGKKYDMWKFYNQVEDSIGSLSIVDQLPRLDYYHANIFICKILQHYGCIGFLTCDDWSYNKEKRVYNYYLTDEQNVLLDKNNRFYDETNKLYFVKTDFRLEQINQRWGNTQSCLDYYTNSKQSKELILFSHEWKYKEYLNEADSIFKWAVENNIPFDYPMNQ